VMPNRADERDPLGADRRFFASLLSADAEELADASTMRQQ